MRIIVQCGRVVLTHDGIDLVLHLGHHVRIVQHVHHGPQHGVFDGLHAGREQVAENLLDLPVGVQALEQLIDLAVVPRVFDLQQVSVDQVPNATRVERAFVFFNNRLKIVGDFLTVIADFFLNAPFVRDMTSRQKEIHRSQHAEQLEALVYHVHVPFESRIVGLETYAHCQ